eukprot:TRINITY_DN527_c0_g1_i1.p1 TRINITY_DN527_c0_g1~~TRINITY_DN527_c0_g1_i1.p1  ORF type:complete len:117 (-),score=23.75 TRINITY_DN527_c0_g1_i1:11-361(-)
MREVGIVVVFFALCISCAICAIVEEPEHPEVCDTYRDRDYQQLDQAAFHWAVDSALKALNDGEPNTKEALRAYIENYEKNPSKDIDFDALDAKISEFEAKLLLINDIVADAGFKFE